MAKNEDKTTVNFTNEILNDAINFKMIIPRIIAAYECQNLQAYYFQVRLFLNHNQHLIVKQSNQEQIKNVRKQLNWVGSVIDKSKNARVKEQTRAYASEKQRAFSILENIELYVKQELHNMGYFKKTNTKSGDLMDEYFKDE